MIRNGKENVKLKYNQTGRIYIYVEYKEIQDMGQKQRDKVKKISLSVINIRIVAY